MPRGEKSKYTAKQERKADHIAESYESRGIPEKEAERRAWATVNKDDGGGKMLVHQSRELSDQFDLDEASGKILFYHPLAYSRSLTVRPVRSRRWC